MKNHISRRRRPDAPRPDGCLGPKGPVPSPGSPVLGVPERQTPSRLLTVRTEPAEGGKHKGYREKS